MHRIKLCLIVTGLFASAGISFPAIAADVYVEVCAIQPQDSGNVLLKPCEDWVSQNGCSNTWVGWRIDDVGGQAMLSVALTAQSTGKRLMLRPKLDGTCIGGDYDQISVIRIVND